jgi:hypothetical protein
MSRLIIVAVSMPVTALMAQTARVIYGKFDTSKLCNKTEFTDLALQIGRSF